VCGGWAVMVCDSREGRLTDLIARLGGASTLVTLTIYE
jgi:hypothetical protein